jgi:hypothetical protein
MVTVKVRGRDADALAIFMGAHGFDMVRSKRISCSGRHTYLAKAITGEHDIFAEANASFMGVPADAEFALA